MKILALSLDRDSLYSQTKTATRLARFGAYVDIYTSIVPSPLVAIVPLARNVVVYGTGGRNKLARLARVYRLATSFIRENRFDVITVQDAYFLGSLAAYIANKFSIALEIQIHGFEKYYGFRKFLAKRNMRRADAIRVVSERLKRELISEFSISPQKITVAPIYTEKGTHSVTAKTNFTFLSVGRLVPIKNVALQIEALAAIRARHPEARLVVVGDGPERIHLERLASRLGIGSAVEFVGMQTDVGSWYSRAHVFLFTSNREGWGLVAVEAASHGLPIIMTDVGLAGEFVIDGQNGIIVPVGGKNELSRAMERLMSSSYERERMGKAALASASALPSFDECMKRYIEGWRKASSRMSRSI